MSACDLSPYVLPTIDFVAGETQELAFHVYFHANGKALSLEGCEANFAVVNYMNAHSVPVISKAMSVDYGVDKDVDNVLTVKLLPGDTIDLSGKYIYQISIRNQKGDVEIPKQGVMIIHRNIDKKYLAGLTGN